MPQVDLAPHRSKRPAIIAVAVSAVGVIAIAAVVVMLSWSKGPERATSVVMNDAREKAFAGKDDEAIALLQKQIGETRSKDEKLALYMQLGGNLENKEDNKAALEAYKNADGIKSGFGTAQSVARMAEAVGDKALALKKYEQCRDLIKDGKTPQNSDFLPSIEKAIERLGGKS